MKITEASAKLKKTEEYFISEIAKIRGSRANPSLLEDIVVEVYNSQMPIKQVGTVNVVDPTLMTVQCWDKQNVEAVKKAIEDSELNVTPSIDGNIVRVPLPSLTEERREELVKIVKKSAEEAKISARRTRHEFLESLENDDGLSEDDVDRGKKEIQKMIDDFNEKVDQEIEKKSEELMKI
jgi:ribosome recycling factor